MSKEYDGKYGIEERTSELDELFNEATTPELDTDCLSENLISLDMDELNANAAKEAQSITEKLAGYYIDENYINNHPYIKNKIAQEIDSIRRQIKMISVNEKAQDAILKLVSMGMAKPAIFSSLTSLQHTMLEIQNKLDSSTKNLETIFEEMQTNSEKTFSDKAKEADSDGQMVAVGSREFIKKITAQMNGEHYDETKDETVSDPNIDETKYDEETNEYYNPATGEIIQK